MENPINLNAYDFHHRISSDEKAVVVDVRTPQEFNDGHLPNSLLIDIYNPTFQNKILELDKTKIIISIVEVATEVTTPEYLCLLKDLNQSNILKME